MMISDLTWRKKVSLILFLLSLFRQVYVCLTRSNCEGCTYEQVCTDSDEKMCSLIHGIAKRISCYFADKEVF